MFISGDSPTRSVRAVPVDGEELLLVGGEGHKTGEGGDTEERYRALERFAREHWDVQSVEYRWSSQDGTTIDGVPYVGPLTPAQRAGADGDRLRQVGHDRRHRRGDDPVRPGAGPREPVGRRSSTPTASSRAPLVTFVEENAKVGLHFVGDRLTKRGTRPIEDLAPGEGDIVRHAGEKVAGHRRDDGTLVAVSPLCTHLGCQVNWNTAERSWDCPCHGSRFAPDGEVLHGPAVHRLEPKPVD